MPLPGESTELNIEILRNICTLENIEITMHVARRLEQHNISIKDILVCVMNGEIIEQYPTDYSYPSCLILGFTIKEKSLHTIIGSNLKNYGL